MKRYFTLSLIILLTVSGALFSNEITYDIRNETENRSALSNQAISQVVNDALDLEGKEDLYAKVRVMPHVKKNLQIDYYIVYLFKRHSYTAEIFRLDVERDNSISVIKDYVEERTREERESCQTCPDEEVEIVLSTSETGSHPAKEGVDISYNDLDGAGKNVVKLSGSEESATAIKNWLSCKNVKMWARIGHGVQNGTIILGSGSFRPSDATASDLEHKFMIINSCFVHNQAMIPQMTDPNQGNAYFFCSGDNVSLPMYSSEPVWNGIIKKGILEDVEFGKAVEDAGNEGNMRLYGYTRNQNAPNNECYWKDVTATYLGLETPNGGAEYVVTTEVDITWSSNAEAKVSLYLCRGSNEVETIVEDTENDGSHTWKIPEDTEQASDYKIKVETDTLEDVSDEAFTIKQKPSILCKNDLISTSLDSVVTTREKTLTIKNEGKGTLAYTAKFGGGGSIMINEFYIGGSKPDDGFEIWNKGGDQDMTGWSVEWNDNVNSSGTYDFEDGYILKEKEFIILTDDQGGDFYIGDLPWEEDTELSIALLDASGKGVDFVRTAGNSDYPPQGTEWDGDGVENGEAYVYRTSNDDSDSKDGWETGTSGTIEELNPGQSLAIRADHWVAASPEEGTVEPDKEAKLTLTFDCEGLELGDYHDTLLIVHDDPDQESPIAIPVKLTVAEGTGTKLTVGTGIASYGISVRGSRIAYQVPDRSDGKLVTLNLYNLKGKLVSVLVNGVRSSGYYSVPITRQNKKLDLATGNYICHMEADGFAKAINVLLR